MRAWLGALAAAALAGCPSPAPPEPNAAPPATAAATEPAPGPTAQPSEAGIAPEQDAAPPAEPPAAKRQVSLMDYQLTAEHVDCTAADEIRVVGYPAGVPDCDTQVVCAVTAPKRAALLASGADGAPCERSADFAAGESAFRPLPELTRKLRKLCPEACCGLIVQGCL